MAYGYTRTSEISRNSLSDSFQQSASPEETPKVGMLEALAPEVKAMASKALNVGPLSQHAVDANKPDAAGQIHSSQVAVSNIQQDASNAKAAISGTIREMQGQIVEATKAAGYDAAKLFPDRSVAADSPAEFFLTSKMAGLGGKGSLVTAAAEALPNADAIAADMRKSYNNPDEIMAAVADILRASASDNEQEASFGGVISSASEQKIQPTSLNINAFLDEHGNEGLAAIMAQDPDHPSEALFPEFKQLDDLEYNANNMLEELQIAENEVEARTDHDGQQEAFDTLELWEIDQCGGCLDDTKMKTTETFDIEEIRAALRQAPAPQLHNENTMQPAA